MYTIVALLLRYNCCELCIRQLQVTLNLLEGEVEEKLKSTEKRLSKVVVKVAKIESFARVRVPSAYFISIWRQKLYNGARIASGYFCAMYKNALAHVNISTSCAVNFGSWLYYRMSLRHVHYLLNEETNVPTKMHSRVLRSRRLTLAAPGFSAAHQRHHTTSDRNNNQHNIYPRNTQWAQQAAILLPSFRSPRLCNYDFIFMDINYTGRLAVSLYGILIQGCRHNGNLRHTDSLLTCP